MTDSKDDGVDESVGQAVEILRDRFGGETPEVHMILGSGLGGLVDLVESPIEVPFTDLPGWPGSGVAGHSGRFVFGTLAGRKVLVQAGRYHLYEGYPESLVVRPIRVGMGLGVRSVVVTNAAGGIRRDLVPGTVMLIDDHINLQFRHALAGPVVPGEERFPDMSGPHDQAFQAMAAERALELGIPLARGTYVAVLGPSYETPAEIRALRTMGADAVGMSTVPEVTVARSRGMRVLGFSLITNLAAGIGNEPLSHEEVSEVGAVAGARLGRLLESLVPGL